MAYHFIGALLGALMSRIIRKSWYTLTEAADYLTQNSKGSAKVTASDVLQFAIDGELTLSIRITQDSTSRLPFASLARCSAYSALSKSERELEKKHIENNKSHPLLGLIFDRKAFRTEYIDIMDLYADVWDIALAGAGGRFFAMLWGNSKLPGAPGPDSFDSAISKLPYRFGDDLVLINVDREIAFSVPIQAMPEGSYLGVRFSELSQLLTGDSANTERQEYPPAMVTLNGESNVKRLQRTVAALALGLAAKPGTYSKAGKPNVSQLAKLATEHLRDGQSDRTPPGFSDTTVRNTITAALEACPELKG
jgi:hypothetical protein